MAAKPKPKPKKPKKTDPTGVEPGFPGINEPYYQESPFKKKKKKKPTSSY